VHGFGVFLGAALILAGSGREKGRARFTGVKSFPPPRKNANLYFFGGCLLLIVEAAYFWFDIDLLNLSTYR